MEIVSFILKKENMILVEKRKKNKLLDPDTIMIPGGKVEANESHENAVTREIKEELNIKAKEIKFLGTKTRNVLNINYYLISQWDGEIKTNEAEELMWIPIDDINMLSFDTDKGMIQNGL